MQYLLTEEELNSLHAKINAKELMPTHAALQEFCTKVANTMIVEEGWAKGRVWGCIRNPPGEKNPHYCDACPARPVCPKPNKSFSK